MSLLDFVLGGSDGAAPSVHDVVWDELHVRDSLVSLTSCPHFKKKSKYEAVNGLERSSVAVCNTLIKGSWTLCDKWSHGVLLL